tara:strand:+ start:1671 stop:3089 length:1419 start_codon:yes stop_codon:yes gene_type:complete
MINNEKLYEGGKKKKQELLGEGSYGCAIMPGLNCIGNYNRSNNNVNKIQEINYYSKNEIEISEYIKKINNFKNRFVPINKFCIVKFDIFEKNKEIINKCENLFEDYSIMNNSEFMNKDYYMFYMKYVKSLSLKKYLYNNFNNNKILYNKYFYSLYYLLNSIYILNKYNIVHNDLHYDNIIYDLNKNIPLIIDFGLSYNHKNLLKNKNYTKNSLYDLKKIKKHYFDWRLDHYHHLTEKRFISFIIYNKQLSKRIDITNDYEKNNLSNEILNIFIDDSYKTIVNSNEIKIIFEDYELKEYNRVLREFYEKFLPVNDKEKRYVYLYNILNELVPLILKFNDLHSLVCSYLQIIYAKLNYEITNYPINSKDYIIIYDFIKQLFKKVLYPNPYYRLSINQFISILSFVLKYCENLNNDDLNNEKYIDRFYNKLDILLKDINYSHDMLYNKNYAYIDFNLILSKENIEVIKSLNLTIK